MTSDPRSAGGLENAKTWLPYGAALLALIMWWPVGFSGTTAYLHLPLSVPSLVDVFAGSLAAATAVAALVRSPWPKVLITTGMAGLGWLLSSGSLGSVEHDRLALGMAILLGSMLGLWVGRRAASGVLSVATVLAVIAAASPAHWSKGALLAVALALPFWAVAKDLVAPTLLSVAKVLVVFVAVRVLLTGLQHGWAALKPVSAIPSLKTSIDRVWGPAWDRIRHHGWDTATQTLQDLDFWLWMAVALAIALVTARILLSVGRREPARREA